MCTNGPAPQPYGWYGTISADGSTITGKDSMQCTQVQLSNSGPILSGAAGGPGS